MRFWISFALVLLFVSLHAPLAAQAERTGCTGEVISCADRCISAYEADKEACELEAISGGALCVEARDECIANCAGSGTCEQGCRADEVVCAIPVVAELGACLVETAEALHECGAECPCDLCEFEGDLATRICESTAELIRLGCEEAHNICTTTCGSIPQCLQCEVSRGICLGIADTVAGTCDQIGDDLTDKCLSLCETGDW